MKVSVLIPIYGVEKYIEQCARSVLGQDYADVEYIFVDDASPDGSVEILREVLKDFTARDVKILVHEKNRGLAAARNTAVDAATGDYVLHVDSDDRIAPHAIAKLAHKAAETGADIVVGGSMDIYPAFTRSRREEVSETYLRNILWRRTRGSIWGKLLRRELYEGIRAMPGLDYGEDFLVYPQLVARARKIVEINEPLYLYNLANTGAISAQPTVDKARQMVEIVDRLAEIFAADKGLVEGMKLHTKVALLQSGNHEAWRYAGTLYPELSTKKGVRLKFSERLVLHLSRRGLYILMPLYRRWAIVKKRLFFGERTFRQG